MGLTLEEEISVSKTQRQKCLQKPLPNTPNPTQDFKNIFLENFQKFDGLHFFQKFQNFFMGCLSFKPTKTQTKNLPDFLIFLSYG